MLPASLSANPDGPGSSSCPCSTVAVGPPDSRSSASARSSSAYICEPSCSQAWAWSRIRPGCDRLTSQASQRPEASRLPTRHSSPRPRGRHLYSKTRQRQFRRRRLRSTRQEALAMPDKKDPSEPSFRGVVLVLLAVVTVTLVVRSLLVDNDPVASAFVHQRPLDF